MTRLTSREAAALHVLRQAVSSGRGPTIDGAERQDQKRFRRRLLYVLRYHGKRQGGHPPTHTRPEGK